MPLTNDQEKALGNILEFVYKPIVQVADVAAILYAAAGCGKTYLTKIIGDRVRGTHRVAGVAPTHKARKVLERFLNQHSLLKIKTMTIASLLNKMRSHTYIGTKHYTNGIETKMSNYDLFLIDEASMITDNDVDLIINYAFQFKRKVLFIGDKYQIPNPSQKYIINGELATKRDSKAFALSQSFGLTTIVRQKEGNPLIEVYTAIRDGLIAKKEPKIPRTSKIDDGRGIQFYTDRDLWLEAVCKKYSKLDLKQMHNVRVLAYTNDTVNHINMVIRRLFKYPSEPQMGELLMGYNNLGWPEKIIENSQDYYIIKTKCTESYSVLKWDNLVGTIVTLQETDSEHVSKVFIPSISASQNKKMLDALIKRAESVNRKHSTKDDFKRYASLKNKLVFMENVYKMGEQIMGESEFRTANPLLFRSVSEVIVDTGNGDRELLKNKLVTDLRVKYDDILDYRIDDDKPLSGSEKLGDRYCVIEKDLDYGYCITSHKSQGSNFHTVFIDESDFDKLHDYWNYDIDCQIDASKERNQLKYVCYTRPTNVAHVYYRP